MKTSLYLAALLAAPAALAQQAAFSSLIITEVQPSTGEVEVTNLSDEEVITARLPFCHRFNYGTSVPSNTTFAPGESRVFNLSGLNASVSDLWLYRPGSFGNAANIISGLNWGGSLQGRSRLATGANLWDGLSLPTPPADQSLQLTPGADPALSTSWTTADPTMGEFPSASAPAPSLDAPTSINLRVLDGSLVLSWEGGTPPYQVFQSDDLQTFERVGRRITDLAIELPLEGSGRFFRVEGAAGPAPTARFEATVPSLWSNLTFASAPSNAGFESLTATTHATSADFWQGGDAPSAGLQALAATNRSALLQNEFISAGSQPIAISGDVRTNQTVTFTFEAELEASQLTLLARLAGMSPTWFTGLDAIALRDENGDWLETSEVALQPWNAGETITPLRNMGPFGPSFFLRQAGEDAPPLGSVQLRRID